jgi:hypothetical protein
VLGARPQQAVAGIAQLEDDLVARLNRGDRRQPRMPAVVSPLGSVMERARAVDFQTQAQSPYERPITSSITSSVPAPIRLRRMSRQARSMPYSFM